MQNKSEDHIRALVQRAFKQGGEVGGVAGLFMQTLAVELAEAYVMSVKQTKEHARERV